MEKKKIEIHPIRPLNSIWDKTSMFVLVIGLSIGVLSFIFIDSKIISAFCVVASFFAFMLLKIKSILPEVRWIFITCLTSLAFGISISIYPVGNPIPLFIGISIFVSISLGYIFMRHPSSYRAAFKAFQDGNQVQALKYISQSIKQSPAHWASYQLRSVIHLRMYKIIEAEHDARKAIQIKPDQYLCHNALGMALLSQQRYIEANESLSKAVELAPQYAINYYNKGVASFRLNEFEETIKNLQFALNNELPLDSLLLGYYYLGHSYLQVGEQINSDKAFKALVKYKAAYEKIFAHYKDAPDYPSILLARRELEDIKNYLG